MFTDLLVSVRMQPENAVENRVVSGVSNRDVLAVLNHADMLIYLAGQLHLLPEQVISWKKLPAVEHYAADTLLDLMFADGFERHDTENGVMILKPVENGVLSFKWDDLQQYDSDKQPEIKGWFIGESYDKSDLCVYPLLVDLDMKLPFQPKLRVEYDVQIKFSGSLKDQVV